MGPLPLVRDRTASYRLELTGPACCSVSRRTLPRRSRRLSAGRSRAVGKIGSLLDPSFAAFLDEQLAYAIHDMTPIRPTWTRRAACRGWSTSLWFPERGENDNGRTAKRICASCPVRSECLAWAQEFGDTAALGIWGGLSSQRRRRARRDLGVVR